MWDIKRASPSSLLFLFCKTFVRRRHISIFFCWHEDVWDITIGCHVNMETLSDSKSLQKFFTFYVFFTTGSEEGVLLLAIFCFENKPKGSAGNSNVIKAQTWPLRFCEVVLLVIQGNLTKGNSWILEINVAWWKICICLFKKLFCIFPPI